MNLYVVDGDYFDFEFLFGIYLDIKGEIYE
jgi:hypothetical protein